MPEELVDAPTKGKTAGLWLLWGLAFVLATDAALWVGATMARSLISPGIGEDLAFDASFGILAGSGLLVGAYYLGKAALAYPGIGRAQLVATGLLAATLGLAFTYAITADAMDHATGSAFGLDPPTYFLLLLFPSALAGAILLLSLIPTKWGSRTARFALFGAGSATVAGMGAVLGGLWLLWKMNELQALARQRTVPAVEVVGLIVVALVALLKPRAGAKR